MTIATGPPNPKHPRGSKRQKLAYDLRRQGLMWKEIATRLGVTTPRARELAAAWIQALK